MVFGEVEKMFEGGRGSIEEAKMEKGRKDTGDEGRWKGRERRKKRYVNEGLRIARS